MKAAEGSGRTVEEAIRDALRILGVKRDEVDLMVLDEGSRGVLGLGSREARVRLTLLSAEAEDEELLEAETAPAADAGDPTSVARSVTSSVLDAMGFRAAVHGREDAGVVLVTITGQQLAPLIGRHGQTLEALELVVNVMVARRLGRRMPVVVDAERYRERRREALQALAQRTASRVRRTGEPVALEPMSASERRIIHTSLAEDAVVTTHSQGEGPDRHVVILARSHAGEAPDAEQAEAAGPSRRARTSQEAGDEAPPESRDDGEEIEE